MPGLVVRDARRCRAPHHEGPRRPRWRHHPRKRMIQYAAPLLLCTAVKRYWMPRFRGH